MEIDQLQQCPDCGEHLRVDFRFRAREIGTFSLSGANPKVSAYKTVWLVCNGCGFSEEGKPVVNPS